MRKLICLMVLAGSLLLFVMAMNQTFINKVKYDRYFDHLPPPTAKRRSLYERLFVRSDRWRYGDLYGMSFLPGYKFKLEPYRPYTRDTGTSPTGKILYIIGDSFLADKKLDRAFDNFDAVVFSDRRFPFGPVILDSTKQNYLVMEFAERNLVDYDIKKSLERRWSTGQILSKSFFNTITPKETGGSGVPSGVIARINKAMFNKDLSRNIELLLFDDKLFTPVKELKAGINYDLFGRTVRETAVSTDKKRLLLNITVDTSFRESAFRNITDSEINKISENLNYAEKYYLSVGFKSVFLSVVPNAVSVYDDKRMHYNHLLERVEKKNSFPVISIWDFFRASTRNLYYRSDAHWNPEGLDLWVDQTRKAINKY
ncbi:hypothetical protein [Mucilaginibacter flavidus]|uniref:hypothetical protein n=1 Tax=Mucilaginibacter flavidus TaxID=2949309 RepID=UPI0020930BE9|nr:hypothetical protein [Mucilaginibacter flavidus]MCO5947672.1 hypothetical protein [Mucilaginibacter flavidus]